MRLRDQVRTRARPRPPSLVSCVRACPHARPETPSRARIERGSHHDPCAPPGTLCCGVPLRPAGGVRDMCTAIEDAIAGNGFADRAPRVRLRWTASAPEDALAHLAPHQGGDLAQARRAAVVHVVGDCGWRTHSKGRGLRQDAWERAGTRFVCACARGAVSCRTQRGGGIGRGGRMTHGNSSCHTCRQRPRSRGQGHTRRRGRWRTAWHPPNCRAPRGPHSRSPRLSAAWTSQSACLAVHCGRSGRRLGQVQRRRERRRRRCASRGRARAGGARRD